MRAGQAGTALGLGRLGRSSNCSSFIYHQGQGADRTYRAVLIGNHDPPLYRISHPPRVVSTPGNNSKIQAAYDACGAIINRTFSKHSVPRPFSETLRERRFYQRMTGTNIEESLSRDGRMLRHYCLEQQSATIAPYSPFCTC